MAVPGGLVLLLSLRVSPECRSHGPPGEQGKVRVLLNGSTGVWKAWLVLAHTILVLRFYPSLDCGKWKKDFESVGKLPIVLIPYCRTSHLSKD